MRRRSMLHLAATAGLASMAPARGAGQSSSTPERVDTHTHFYDPGRPQGVPWPEKGSWLHRRVMPDEWAARAQPHAVTHTVVVEASDWIEDNQWLLDLAARDARILGVVGNLDPMAPEFPVHLRRFASDPLFRGIRNRRPNAELPALAGLPRFRDSLKRLADAGLSLDLNIGRATDLEAVARVGRAVPDLRIIIDHVAGAGDPRRLSEAWKTGLQAAASPANVFCKLSGLPEQADFPHGQAPGEPEFYHPILDAVWNAFGEDRLLFGSNWPVSDKGISYARTLFITQTFVAVKDPRALNKVFLANSRAAYRWIAR